MGQGDAWRKQGWLHRFASLRGVARTHGRLPQESAPWQARGQAVLWQEVPGWGWAVRQPGNLTRFLPALAVSACLAMLALPLPELASSPLPPVGSCCLTSCCLTSLLPHRPPAHLLFRFVFSVVCVCARGRRSVDEGRRGLTIMVPCVVCCVCGLWCARCACRVCLRVCGRGQMAGQMPRSIWRASSAARWPRSRGSRPTT
jgi:hypothetical protein